MLGFFAFINLGKDISQEIIKLMKKNIKENIDKYINEMRKTLFNIILYYSKKVLNSYDEENNNDFQPNSKDLPFI